jgi:hypothetical protein
MQEKAEQGIWPTKTPLGYRNVMGEDGRKVIVADQEMALSGDMRRWTSSDRRNWTL